MATRTPLLNGYYPPPQQGGYFPSGHGPLPPAYSPETQPWYHPNIPYNHYPAYTGMQPPAPLFPHSVPPMRGTSGRSAPWRGSRGRGQGRGPCWSDVSKSLLECKPCNKQYKSRDAYDTHIQSHVQVRRHTVYCIT